MGKFSDALLSPPEPEKKEKREQFSFSDALLSGGAESGFVGNVPLGSVFTEENMGQQTDPAGMGTQFKTGFVDKPENKIKVYASARFPDMPEAERNSRYGVHQGEIVYLDDDGKLYRETPDTWINKLKRFAAETGPHLPTIVMSTIGAAAGPWTAMLGAAGGEGIRQSVGAIMGEPKTPIQAVTGMGKESALALGGEVAGAGISRGLGYLGAKRGGKLVAAAGRGRDLIDPAGIKRLEDLGGKFDIDLYPPQTTGSKRLAEKFKLLGDIESSAPIIQKAREKQGKQIDDAVYKFLDEIAPPETTSFRAGEKVVEAAKAGVKKPVLVRQAKAGPMYEKAFKETSVIDKKALSDELSRNTQKIKLLGEGKPEPDIEAMAKALDEKGIPAYMEVKEGKKAYSQRIGKDYKRLIKKEPPTKGGGIDTEQIKNLEDRNSSIKKALKGKPPKGFDAPTTELKINTSGAISEINDLLSATVPQDPSYKALNLVKEMIVSSGDSLQKLDRVKRSGIDNVLNRSGTSATLAREMNIVKDKLLSAMDVASPTYKKARKIYGDLSEEVTKQGKKTIAGDLAKLEGDKVITAAKKLFSSIDSSPTTVKRAKRLIKNQNPAAWDEAMRVHLQDLFESTKQSATGDITNTGGHFYKKVWGNTRQKKILEAAMDKNQFQNLSDFMTVLKRSGLILGKESATATRQAMMEEMQGPSLSRVVRVISRPLVTKEKIFGDQLLQSVLYKNAKQLAEVMTSEKAAVQLKKMMKLPPTVKKVLPQFTTFLTMVSKGSFSDYGKDTIPEKIKVMPQGRHRLTQ